MEIANNIFLFGEDVSDLHIRLRDQLIEARSKPFLNLLFQQAGSALRYEVGQLPSVERHEVPEFSTLDELNARAESTHPHAGVQTALLCLSQIAQYIRYTEMSRGKQAIHVNALVVGFDAGSLAAAAISLSPALSTLVPLAVQLCLVAFRIGRHVRTVARLLENKGPDASPSFWSDLVIQSTESHVHDILDIFNAEENIHCAGQAWIRAVDEKSVTLTGASSTLTRIQSSHLVSSLSIREQGSSGPFNAEHARSLPKTQEILRSQDQDAKEFFNSYEQDIPFVAMSFHAPADNSMPTLALLESVVDGILYSISRSQTTIARSVRHLTSLNPYGCHIITCGPTRWQSQLATTLEQEIGTDVKVTAYPSRHAQSIPHKQSTSSGKAKLAIVGMAGRFPDAADHEKLWELLYGGHDLHRKVPNDRFDVKKHYDLTGKIRNTSHTPYGCFIDEPGLFDPRFFNMSPREATQTDPMHRLGLASAYEALEMSGYVPNRTPSTRLDRIGTFYGQTSDDWREINAAQEVDTYFITGGVRAFAPGRVNYYFKFNGPSFSIDTACSSSAAAMQLACTSLRAGECDTAVAGGLNVMTNSDIFAGLSRGQFLSKTGNCQTYDNDADGYCRGDGIGTIVLKRLEDADADNDRILGVILETATNHSSNAVSITHPHAPTQETLFQKVMDDAGIDPHDVNYVEMHGTGTQAGDGTEMLSVTNVFAPPSRAGTRKKQLHLGSVKANVGHGEAASGVTAMIKSLMMLQKSVIPPHCGIKGTINQGFPQDLNYRNVHIAFKPTPFESPDASPRRILVNNFSAAGGNTATLIEEAPSRPMPQDDPRDNWIVVVSAKSKSALRANTSNLVQYMKQNPMIRLPDLSYTTTARRIQHNYRIAVNSDSTRKAIEALSAMIEEAVEPISNVAPSVAFAYTGQGSHYTALGHQLFVLSSTFRSDLMAMNQITLGFEYPSFLPLLDPQIEAKELAPLLVQLGLCCIQIALTRWWAAMGVKPSVVVGHSLGEYAALQAAGVISVSDAIYLVGERAKLLQEKCASGSHAMLAIKTPIDQIIEALADTSAVEIACINGAAEIVLGGSVQEIDRLAEKLNKQGIKCTKLNTSYAFHSNQVDPILEDFERIAGAVQFNNPRIPIISPLLSTVISEGGYINATYLKDHARLPVNFLGGLASAQWHGTITDKTLWVELGPHPVCLSFIKSELGADVVATPTLRKGTAPYKSIADSLITLYKAGLALDWNEYHRDFIPCVRMLNTPSYAFDNKTYWIQYTGDWNLKKGQVGSLGWLPEIEEPKLSTTTVQKVVSEEVKNDKATVVIESDVSRPDLLAAISGHVVNGTALCPSSIYADMALTVGEHLYRLLHPNSDPIQMNVCNMEVFKPFIANNGGAGQTISLSGTASLDGIGALLHFSSGSGRTTIQHAKCYVKYGSGEQWLAEWQRQAYMIKDRIERLKSAATSGKAHRMLRGMAYKLFGAFVEYDQKFRGMEEVILDSPQLEATASISFQTKEADGQFLCSPYWIDSVCHLAGFVVNANDAVDSGKQVYVSHGWETMRFAEPLESSKTYRSYVKMQPLGNNMVAGDVYILDGDRIVGLCGALKFQCIPRTLLNTFLPPKGSAAVITAKATTKAAPRTGASTPTANKSCKQTKVKSAKPPKLTLSVTSKVLDIIAAEVGIALSELADAIDFADIGVDSLMTLAISGRIKEEMEIDCASTAFVDYPTVGALKGYLGQFETSEGADAAEQVSDGNEEIGMISSSSGEQSSDYESASIPSSPPSTPGEPNDSDSLSATVRQTISEQMDVDIAELMSVEDLSSIGMDSLMALSIIGILREIAGVALPSDFLVEHTNIRAIEQALHITPPDAKPKAKPNPKSHIATPATTQATGTPISNGTPNNDLNLDILKIKKPTPPARSATSILLQGNPKTASKTFFLVPDGGGAPTSYIFPSEIAPILAVWGLTSPFVKNPEEYIIGVPGIATAFLREIKRRQPKGPYNVGGWSAGGVISFEVCQQLIAAGDVVDTLIFIDTPCPLIIEPLPGTLHRFFGEIGLLGDGEGAIDRLPPWLLPHFAASVHALATYDAKRLPKGKCPRVYTMWCKDGVCKEPEDPKPEPYPYGHAQWLLENRSDFGPNLWDQFVEREKMIIRQMGGNHFSMMREPRVHELVEFLREALG